MLMETGISKKDQVSELLDPVSVDTSHNRRIQCNCARSSQVLLRAKYDGPVGKPKCSASRLAAMLAMSKSDSEGLTQLGLSVTCSSTWVVDAAGQPGTAWAVDVGLSQRSSHGSRWRLRLYNSKISFALNCETFQTPCPTTFGT